MTPSPSEELVDHDRLASATPSSLACLLCARTRPPLGVSRPGSPDTMGCLTLSLSHLFASLVSMLTLSAAALIRCSFPLALRQVFPCQLLLELPDQALTASSRWLKHRLRSSGSRRRPQSPGVCPADLSDPTASSAWTQGFSLTTFGVIWPSRSGARLRNVLTHGFLANLWFFVRPTD